MYQQSESSILIFGGWKHHTTTKEIDNFNPTNFKTKMFHTQLQEPDMITKRAIKIEECLII